MMRQTFALGLGLVVLAALATQADAAKRAKMPPGAIVVSGCTKAAPPFCTMLSGPGGKIYSLVGAKPPVPLNVGVTVVGMQEGVIGTCFAPTLRVLKWSRNRLRCPKP